jgi:hypothetical protein
MDSLNDDIEELTAQLAAERAAREKAEARVKVLEEALEYAALCPVCADIEECKCQPDCEDCVKTMQKARAALLGEEQGK